MYQKNKNKIVCNYTRRIYILIPQFKYLYTLQMNFCPVFNLIFYYWQEMLIYNTIFLYDNKNNILFWNTTTGQDLQKPNIQKLKIQFTYNICCSSVTSITSFSFSQ